MARLNLRGTTSAAVVLTLALGFGGCASTIADLPVVGLPEGAPARPANPGSYLPVHDVPKAPDAPVLAPAEQARIEAELIAARDRQAIVLPPKGAKGAKPAPPASGTSRGN